MCAFWPLHTEFLGVKVTYSCFCVSLGSWRVPAVHGHSQACAGEPPSLSAEGLLQILFLSITGFNADFTVVFVWKLSAVQCSLLCAFTPVCLPQEILLVGNCLFVFLPFSGRPRNHVLMMFPSLVWPPGSAQRHRSHFACSRDDLLRVRSPLLFLLLWWLMWPLGRCRLGVEGSVVLHISFSGCSLGTARGVRGQHLGRSRVS